MQIGIPWWIGSGTALEGIQRAAEMGADFVEISLDAPWPQNVDGRELARASEELGVSLAFHGPWRDQALAHPREELAKASRSVAQSCLDLARASNAEYIVFHGDARGYSSFPAREPVEEGLQQAHASLRAMSSATGETTLLVENTTTPLGTPEEVHRFLNPLPEVGFCYDPGHAVLAEEAGTEGARGDIEAWLDLLGDRYEALHLMDWTGTEHGIVDHLVPGAGSADLEALLEATWKADCEMVLVESFFKDTRRTDATPEDLDQAVETVRELAP